MRAWIRRRRIWISRGVVLVFLPVVFVTHHSWPEDTAIDATLDLLGEFFVAVGVLGRIWATVHIAGRKDRELVTSGPYSFCRNPLYLFTGIILLGFLCAFENALLVVPVITLFAITYFVTVREEEQFLDGRFGREYVVYANRVPRILPALGKYRRDGREQVEVNLRVVLRGIGDAGIALLVFPLAELIEHLHTSGALPIWFYV